MHRVEQALAACALLVVATGCSASVGAPSVDHLKLSTLVEDRLTETVGQRPDKVVCPDDLKGAKDATTRCMLTAGRDTYGVTLTTTSVKGTQVNFDILVDDEPQA